ncbi:MAG: RecQ family ATP-dependent DNA helicase [Treponema sp.]|jgi:ATP-dependent DNA helicase RecQ|nr:RecQ family ATP-dependent DNA helicase [Treponema sp.]
MTDHLCANPDGADPLNEAARSFFGIAYLFPYQRLVIANILEAAQAAGIPLYWPGDSGGGGMSGRFSAGGGFREDACEGSRENTQGHVGEESCTAPSDRDSMGRQIVILPTGAGKSLCFQLPAMLMEGPTLVIYPLLGLMADQERRLRNRGFPPVLIRGGQSGEERRALWEALRRGRSKCIIANPEVLLAPQVMETIGSLGIVHVVIDEAHCVSEWGESFRPAYLEISRIIEAARAPLVTAFTATAGKPVLEKIESHIFGGAGARRITGNPGRDNIRYAARGCILRDVAVRDILLATPRPAIVFCSSRPGTEKLALYLRNEIRDLGLDWSGEIRFYHAGLSREEKADLEAWFLPHPGGVLVSTCAFGMGIDKPNIRMVIHRDCPPSVEAYLQEAGRAGRDGAQSGAVLLFGPEDEAALHRARTESARNRLGKLLDYARNAGRCRREALLELLDYEGNGGSPESSCCDVCEGQASAAMREEASLLDFFRRNGRCFTLNEALPVLTQAGQVRWSGEEARQALERLILEGKLEKMGNLLWKNKLRIPRSKGPWYSGKSKGAHNTRQSFR